MTLNQILNDTKKYNELIGIIKKFIYSYNRKQLSAEEVLNNLYLQFKDKEFENIEYLYKACQIQVKSNNSKSNYKTKRDTTTFENENEINDYEQTIEINDNTELKIDIENLTQIYIKSLDKNDQSLFNIYYIKDNKTGKELNEYFKVRTETIWKLKRRGQFLTEQYYEYIKNNINK